jgi:hypothetical protein
MESCPLPSNSTVVLNTNLPFPPQPSILRRRSPQPSSPSLASPSLSASLPNTLSCLPLPCLVLSQVESGLVYFNFKKQNPRVESIRPHQLRKSVFLSYLPSSPLIRHRVLVTSFGKRRKTLRASLKGFLLSLLSPSSLPSRFVVERREDSPSKVGSQAPRGDAPRGLH